MPNICRLLIFSDCRQLAKNKLQNFKIFGNFLFFQIVVSWQKINSKTYHIKTYLRWRKFCLSYLLEDWRNIFFPLIRLSSLGITGYYLAGHRKWKFFQLCQKSKISSKTSHEKPILLDFVNLSTVLSKTVDFGCKWNFPKVYTFL